MIKEERLYFEEEIRNKMTTMNMIDWSKIDMEEMIREYSEEEEVRLMKNIVMMLKLQKQVLELQVAEKKKKRR